MNKLYERVLYDTTQLIFLQESGRCTGWTLDGYAEAAEMYGVDNPIHSSNNVNDFVFVSKEYALEDDSWDVDPDWPDDLPVWKYRPA